MSFSPTANQALMLFSLLARHGEGAQAELALVKPAPDRQALVEAKFISEFKLNRAIMLKLEDAGWAWAAANLSAELPSAQRTLAHFLTRLSEHLARTGATLADFVGPKPPEAVPPVPPQKGRGRATKPRTPRPPSAKTLRERIEAAYLGITDNRKNEFVRLKRLRAELSDLDRATVDQGLERILKGDKEGKKMASLMRHDDPRQLDRDDHEAAFNPSGEPFHGLWIAS